MDLPKKQAKEEVLKHKFFRIAQEQMFISDHETRMGAVLVINNKHYFASHNYVNKTHPLIKKHYPNHVQSIHAELNALIKYNEVRFGRLLGAKMYVYREDRHGVMKNSKPCKSCEKLMKEAGIRKVYYSITSGYRMEVL